MRTFLWVLLVLNVAAAATNVAYIAVGDYPWLNAAVAVSSTATAVFLAYVLRETEETR